VAIELNPPGGYTLIGPDGTTVVFQDSSNPNFVGYLRDISGLDGADVRENTQEIPAADGLIQGDNLHGGRPITIDGFIVSEGLTAAQRNARIDKLLRASLAMTADAELRWTESGGVPVHLYLRRQQPTRITDRLPKSFLLSMVSANPRIEGQTENSQQIVAGGSTGNEGFPFPMAFPLNFRAAGSGSSVSNIVTYGNAPAVPRFRIDGPITNPTILNNTTGKQIKLNYTLGAGAYLIVNARDHTIKLNGATDVYSALDFANSTWWNLQAGTNDVRLLSTTFTAPAALTTYWRDSWL